MKPAENKDINDIISNFAKAFDSPKRLAIVDALRHKELSVGDIAESIGVPQANASQHLSILKEKGVLKSRRNGKGMYYSLTTLKFVEVYDLLSQALRERMADSEAESKRICKNR